MEGVIAEYGADEENTNEVDASMALLFSARVCVGHLSRIDDCRQYAFCVGSQQFRGVGICWLLEARQTAFFSRRSELLVGVVDL